jgi:hypothetical protein
MSTAKQLTGYCKAQHIAANPQLYSREEVEQQEGVAHLRTCAALVCT